VLTDLRLANLRISDAIALTLATALHLSRRVD
jgi:hypothetical protein